MSLAQYVETPQNELFEELGVFFAFSNEQFQEQKQEGVKYSHLGSGTICPTANVAEFIKRHNEIVNKGIEQDKLENGKRKIILRELHNYECFYISDPTDAIHALSRYGFTEEDVLDVFNNATEEESDCGF